MKSHIYVMSVKCRNTPSAVQRQLRQEANFGCCRCGLPLLDNAHIIPYHITHEFRPEDMSALCPTCHRIADDGQYSEKYLRELKANPRNKTSVAERFLIEGEKLVLNLGGNKFIDSPRILTINDFDIITMGLETGGYITFSLSLFDIKHNLIAAIVENKWIVNTSMLWDLEYKPRQLKIRNASRQLSFTMKIEGGEVFVTGKLYYLGKAIIVTNDELMINEVPHFGKMKNCVFENNTDSAIRLEF